MDRPPVNRPRDEARFDEELRRAARSLIREDLPRDLLDPVVAGSTRSLGGVTTRRALPGFAAAASAVAVLLVATAVALAPGGIQPAATGSGGPPASETLGMQVSPAPSSFALRPTSSLVSELTMLGYRCNDGKDLESPKAGEDAVVRESSICTAPDSAGPLIGAVVIGEAKGGRVVHLEVKANIVGDDTGEARRAVATMLAEAAALGPKPKDDGIYVKQWVLSKVPGLEKNEGVELQARGLSMRIFRSSTGSYALSMSGL